MSCSAGVAVGALLLFCSTASGQFVNFESPHVNPIDLTPSGNRLLAVNTADNRLEVFQVSPAGLTLLGSIPVGIEPVSVRARSNTHAWVVNHISDTVNVVHLATMTVQATLHPGDEPTDVVFAGDPVRAFVSVSQRNQIMVYDPDDLSVPPVAIDVEGEDPRALATDGTTVYAAIFDSGNNTTVLPFGLVSLPARNPYPGDPNPPPNNGLEFDPPLNPDLPPAPPVALMLRKDASGDWFDDNGSEWAVDWDLHDHDVAIIDANSLSVTYATGLMNANMALSVNPAGGVYVVGTDAINEVRFEPNLNGIFVRVMGAIVNGAGGGHTVVDLNPHLDYSTPTVPQSVRDQSIGDPRGIAWSPAGDRAYITGMGSNNVAVVDASLDRVGLVEVGEGPTGVRYDAARDRVYVLNKFEASVSVIDADTLMEIQRTEFFDPTPAAIREGRPFLYDTHRTSGLGQASCASCHIDGRMDQLAWDLGDPSGDMQPFAGNCRIPGACPDWHPMKGPMTTQTLMGIIGTEPFHWRGDRVSLAAFNPAFASLMGDDELLSPQEMAQFTAFVATLRPPPNPFRTLTNALPAVFPNNGSPINGSLIHQNQCVTCHATSSGAGIITPNPGSFGSQSAKIPQLRNLYEKTGFDKQSTMNNRGFGFSHDGSIDSIVNFLAIPFQLTQQERLDVASYLMCFSIDTHAGLGTQITLPESWSPQAPMNVGQMIALTGIAPLGLIAKGIVDGEQRGWYYDVPSVLFLSDREEEASNWLALVSGASGNSRITFTLVPAGTEVRLGVDRDEDGYYDRDEIDAGSDPADPLSTPGNIVPGDATGDGEVDIDDFLLVLGSWGTCPDPCQACAADLNGDCEVGIEDFLIVLGNWG